jgi:hypothetical protein
VLVADVLITAVLTSLVAQIWRHHDTSGFWTLFWGQPVFGYGDPLYFITSAFIWLQGLIFFRMLCGNLNFYELRYAGMDRLKAGSYHANDSVLMWVKPAFIIFGISIVAFYLLQRCFNVPDPYDSTKYCSPLEDVHSFGSFGVTLLIFVIASWKKQSWWWAVLSGIGVFSLLALVVVSWSRATWLVGILVLFLVAWIRLPKRWSIAVGSLGVMAIAIVNLNANRESWQRNQYLWRLITLVRVENPMNKSPDRLNLYYKTVGMIREHPFVGYGIGSTYLTSVHFARPGDPYADVPNFAHNFLLQISAELGVPVAMLFTALIGVALWRGYRKAHFHPASYGAGMSPTLAVTMALTAYLITQMTANALNIYVSNQFFFWFLMAALLCANPKSEVESLKLRVGV